MSCHMAQKLMTYWNDWSLLCFRSKCSLIFLDFRSQNPCVFESILYAVFNKVPNRDAIEKDSVSRWINKSIKKAENSNIYGKDLTPFLIKEINKISNDQTLKANISLIINNADLAGKISKEFYS